MQRTWRSIAALASVALASLASACPSSYLTIERLRCEYIRNPQGIDVVAPRLSWVLKSDARGQKQTAYRVLVASSAIKLAADEADLWDSGKVANDQTIHVVYQGKPLQTRMQCFWKVQVWDKDGKMSPSSEPASWSMGLLKPTDWPAQWIAAPAQSPLNRGGDDDVTQRPVTVLRKEFDVSKPIKRAVVSVTGLGLYELHVNGQRVGDHLLAPEWTRYCTRIQYQTYEVTDLLRGGKNAVGAQVADGWWIGPVMGQPHMPNAQPCLLMRLDIELADGGKQTILSDPSWQATTDGPIRRTGIYFGETYDATKEMPGWDQPGFAAAGWLPTQVLPFPESAEHSILVAQRNEPIRVEKELRPVKMTEPKPGVYVFDMGQNMVGWCRLKVNAPAGTKITVRHAEMLLDDGMIFTANLLGAAQINEYTWRGGEASLEPHFTYHGFRYVEVTALPSRPTEDAIVGRVFHSDAPETGRVECSNELINKILHCAEWSQRGNMQSVPTDCPQRSERAGWMGDIQAFSQTAIFQRDMAAFFTKWAPDLRDSQCDDGRFSDVAPHGISTTPSPTYSGAAAWADAAVIIPWRMYQNYADGRMLEEQYEAIKRWIEYIHAVNPDLLWQNQRGADYGDWLNGGWLTGDGRESNIRLPDYPRGLGEMPHDVFATAFFANSTGILAKMAKALRRNEDAAKYSKLFDDIKAAFNKAYVSPDGRIKGDNQAGYALALHFNLLEEAMRPKAMEHLMEAIKKFKDHPSTGIQSSHRMMLELTRNGRHDEAYRLINLRTVPSWGYMVEMGATTIWERWDAYVKGRVRDEFEGSYNHWAFGSVGEWVWRELAGINPDDEQPGYKHFIIRPRPCPGLTWVKAEYDSIRGKIVSAWKLEERRFSLHIQVPVGTTATVYVPVKDAGAVMENGKPAARADGVKFVKMEGGNSVFAVESGQYLFQAEVGP
jgi:alpha-L-rhamnosidase